MDLEGLSLLHGDDLKLTDTVSLKHPKLRDIVEIGENEYSTYLSSLCSTSVDVADILWFELKIWYEDIKDEWEFFIQRCMSNSKKINVKMPFGNRGLYVMEEDCMSLSNSYRDALNFFFGLSGEYIIIEKDINNIKQKLICNVNPYYDPKTDELLYYIYDENNFKYTKFFYEMTTNFLDSINWQERDYDFLHGGSVGAKKYILKNTLWKQRNNKKKKKDVITLASITSSLIAKGCPFDVVWNLPIYTVYDIYYRHFKIIEYNNTMTALYNGCIDTKKNPINWEKINWSTIIK